MPIDEALTVAELLEQSRAAHAEYRANVPRMAGGGAQVVAVDGDVVKAAAALELAARLRKQAYAQDPDLLEDAWQIDHGLTGGPHVLMTWYAEHLGRVDDPVAVAAQRMAAGEVSPAVAAKDAAAAALVVDPVPAPAPVVIP